VKASNIMVISGRRPALEIKLVDLGIVSIPSEDRFTAASVFLGSKHSAPLEQLTGDQVDERTDIYGAGSVLYHCVRGEPMYNNVGPEGAIVLRMRDRPEALSSSGGEGSLESALVEFINRCIAVEPAMRPASAADCLRQLARLRS
jgi:serine/threonine protein kinase